MEQLKQREEYSMINESPQRVSNLLGLLTALRGGVRRRTNTSVERAAASCQCRRALAKTGTGSSIQKLSTSSKMATRSPATAKGRINPVDSKAA